VALAVGLSSACHSGTPFPPFDYTSVRVLCGGASVLGGGATGAPSSSDHSDITALCFRVVRSPPSEMPPSLRGATPAVLLFFAGQLICRHLFPLDFLRH